jgi:hypothetical protein
MLAAVTYNSESSPASGPKPQNPKSPAFGDQPTLHETESLSSSGEIDVAVEETIAAENIAQLTVFATI